MAAKAETWQSAQGTHGVLIAVIQVVYVVHKEYMDISYINVGIKPFLKVCE